MMKSNVRIPKARISNAGTSKFLQFLPQGGLGKNLKKEDSEEENEPVINENFYTYMVKTRGTKTSEYYVKEARKYIDPNPPEHHELLAIITLWKSFPLDPEKFVKIEGRNKKSYDESTENSDTSYWSKRTENLKVARAYFTALYVKGLSPLNLSWGTLSQIEVFREPVDSFQSELTNAFTPFKFMLYTRWLPNVTDFEETFIMYVERWSAVLEFITKAHKKYKLEYVEEGSNFEGSKIRSAYLRFPAKTDTSKAKQEFDGAKLSDVLEKRQTFELLAASATPDIRSTLQCQNLRQNLEASDEKRSHVAEFMSIIISKYDPNFKVPELADLSVGSEFTNSYYTAVKFYATTIRMANRFLFGRTSGAKSGVDRNKGISIDRDRVKEKGNNWTNIKMA